MGEWPKDWIDGIHEEEGGVDHYGARPKQSIELIKDAMYGLICKNSMWKAWDDSTNVELNVEDVKGGELWRWSIFRR